MNPYMNMASDAVYNATAYINTSAQDFMVYQWPVIQQRMDILWAQFQNDPQRWIALYPLALLVLALAIWTKNPGAPVYNKDVEDMEVEDDHPADILHDNMMTRNRRVILVTPRKRADDHPMVRRSQATRVYLRFQ